VDIASIAEGVAAVKTGFDAVRTVLGLVKGADAIVTNYSQLIRLPTAWHLCDMVATWTDGNGRFPLLLEDS